MPYAHPSGFPSPCLAQSNTRGGQAPALRKNRDREGSPTVLHRNMKHPHFTIVYHITSGIATKFGLMPETFSQTIETRRARLPAHTGIASRPGGLSYRGPNQLTRNPLSVRCQLCPWSTSRNGIFLPNNCLRVSLSSANAASVNCRGMSSCG